MCKILKKNNNNEETVYRRHKKSIHLRTAKRCFNSMYFRELLLQTVESVRESDRVTHTPKQSADRLLYRSEM